MVAFSERSKNTLSVTRMLFRIMPRKSYLYQVKLYSHEISGQVMSCHPMSLYELSYEMQCITGWERLIRTWLIRSST